MDFLTSTILSGIIYDIKNEWNRIVLEQIRKLMQLRAFKYITKLS